MKMEQPNKKSIQGQFFNCQLMNTFPKIIIIELAVTSSWVATALQRALATNTQMGHPPAFFTALRRAPARAVTDNISYAKATARSREDPPTNSVSITSSSEDIKALMSTISVIDIGEIVLLRINLRLPQIPWKRSSYKPNTPRSWRRLKITQFNPSKI
ncbi:hypothetical protein EVAR_86738_1 [Eumeta japonica]|uniref:Uncharacterized protein n=1 Tax=Eumeta variegata TaxID=151549 RepID=A0A4C1VZ18_EUMVA|nr:hypothetical protein EVAR_86738_1 [Eumeta japonica]